MYIGIERLANTAGGKKGAEVVSEPVKPKPHYWGITVH